MSGPVLFIHTRSGCGPCSNLMRPENYSKLRNLILKANPQTTIRIINHPAALQPQDWWTKVNTTDEYVSLGPILWTPMFTVTTESNSKKGGDPTQVEIFGGKYDPQKKHLLKIESSIGMEKWLIEMLNPEKFKLVTLRTPTKSNADEVQKLLASVQSNSGIILPPEVPKIDGNRTCYNFRLVGL